MATGSAAVLLGAAPASGWVPSVFPAGLLLGVGLTAPNSQLVESVLLLTLVVGACLLILHCLQLRRRRGTPGQRRLFRDLCRIHHLSGAERRLLQQLANWHRLDQTTDLFLAPERFEADKLGPSFANRLARVEALRQRLFGGESPQGPRPGSPRPT